MWENLKIRKSKKRSLYGKKKRPREREREKKNTFVWVNETEWLNDPEKKDRERSEMRKKRKKRQMKPDDGGSGISLYRQFSHIRCYWSAHRVESMLRFFSSRWLFVRLRRAKERVWMTVSIVRSRSPDVKVSRVAWSYNEICKCEG